MFRLLYKFNYLQSILNKGPSPLHTACQKGDIETVERLQENRADVNLRYENGFTPLYIACEHGYSKIV